MSYLGAEERVTIQFDHVPLLEEVIKRLAKNVAIVYSKDPNISTPKIVKVFLLSEGQVRSVQVERSGVPPRTDTAKEAAPPPEPFKFEFDPSQHEELK